MALMSPLFEHNLQTNKTLWNWTKALSNWKHPHVAGGVRTTIAKHHHRFRLKWRILICFSSQKKSKQILANEIKKHDLRKELHLLKSKAYNLRNFSTFAAILKILNPQCIAIVVRTPPAHVANQKKIHAIKHLPTPFPPRFSLPRPESLAITFCGIFELIGSFSIDDGNGSENVSFKMNSRFFTLCRVYSNLLKMASVGEFPWSWFLEDRTQV